MYFVYILECRGGRLYTGITTDVERRFLEHKSGTGGHFTRAFKPIRVVYTEHVTTRSAAQRREAAIKKLTRKAKKRLISSL